MTDTQNVDRGSNRRPRKQPVSSQPPDSDLALCLKGQRWNGDAAFVIIS
jgi:hypothetical protein